MKCRIKDLREDHDLEQRQVADILFVNQRTYSCYELGKINIPVSVLCRLADFYDTSVDYLLGRTDERKPHSKTKKRK